MSYVKIPKENYDKALEELESAVDLAREAGAGINRALRENRRRIERIGANRHRSGLLRD